MKLGRVIDIAIFLGSILHDLDVWVGNPGIF